MGIMSRVAVVTGSNKGIGYAVVKLLCQHYPDWTVYLTSRDPKLGKAAVNELKAIGLNPAYHQLDILSLESIQSLRDHLKSTHGGLDVLVNNAGIAYKVDSTAPFGEQARVTSNTNYFATMNVCKELFPLLRNHARVVNVSSLCGHSNFAKLSPELKNAFKRCSTIEQIDGLLNSFINLAETGDHVGAGWGTSAYGTGKTCVTAATFIQQRMLDADKSREDLVVNAVCPGYCNTDMSSHKGPKSPEEGADSIIYLATLPPHCQEPRGRYVTNRTVVDLF